MGRQRGRGKALTNIPIPLAVGGGALLGAIVGSFVATLVIRWPAGQSVMQGRSRCDHCGQMLSVIDLIPILSFTVQRGRSRCCQTLINPRHIWIEIACALIGALTMLIAPGWGGLAGALFGWMLLALAVLDVDHLWLPNAITLPLGFIGLMVGVIGQGVPMADRVIGAVAGYSVFELVRISYRLTRKREGMGGGDPKLLGAIGAWVGWQALPVLVLGASVSGLFWLLLKLVRGRPVTAADRLPFGALLAGAGFVTWMIITTF
jgi:leader peptidase (prepilin peptidase) / N-methyltransferase